jgi:hypothetical protein
MIIDLSEAAYTNICGIRLTPERYWPIWIRFIVFELVRPGVQLNTVFADGGVSYAGRGASSQRGFRRRVSRIFKNGEAPDTKTLLSTPLISLERTTGNDRFLFRVVVYSEPGRSMKIIRNGA